jgi:hypothetical protein
MIGYMAPPRNALVLLFPFDYFFYLKLARNMGILEADYAETAAAYVRYGIALSQRLPVRDTFPGASKMDRIPVLVCERGG